MGPKKKQKVATNTELQDSSADISAMISLIIQIFQDMEENGNLTAKQKGLLHQLLAWWHKHAGTSPDENVHHDDDDDNSSSGAGGAAAASGCT